MLKLAVVIPTYNERENLPVLMESLQGVVAGMDVKPYVLIVDDGSPDGTGAVADDLAVRYGNIFVLHRSGKGGLGSAYKEGFRHVLDKFDPDVVVQMDADHSHDPKYIPSMVEMVARGNDLVVGSRRVADGGVAGWSCYRKSVSSTANMLARTMCGLDVKDATSGFRAFSRRCLKGLDMDSVGAEGYAFQI